MGERLRTPGLYVANLATLNGRIPLDPGSRPDDGRFEVYAQRDTARLAVLRTVATVSRAATLAAAGSAVSGFVAETLTVETNDGAPIALALDGEPAPAVPRLEFRIRSRPLQALVTA